MSTTYFWDWDLETQAIGNHGFGRSLIQPFTNPQLEVQTFPDIEALYNEGWMHFKFLPFKENILYDPL